MAGRLEGRVAIVSGAGAIGPGWGNGKASAVLYAREGAKAFCVDLNEAAAAETAEIIRGAGGEATAWTSDVSDGAAVAAMVAACRERYGRIDILHNNVGIMGLGGVLECAEADWRRVMDVNVTSMFLTSKHTIPAFLEQGGGVIVNISSISGIRAARAEIAYAASKCAINGLTINIALEFAARNIRCNAIVPGLMKTPMVAAALEDHYGPGGLDRMIQARDALSPTGKMGDGWDVAHAAVFLASDEAKYINGALLVVDGGLTQKLA